jgi:hypothetical protein
MSKIAIKIVRQKTETKYLYSYNDGSWSTSLNFNNLDLLKQVSGMSPDQVVTYIQLQSEGCVVALSRASGITAYLYLPAALKIGKPELKAVYDAVLAMMKSARVEVRTCENLLGPTFPDKQNVAPYQPTAANGNLAVRYVDESSLLEVLLHPGNSQYAAYSAVFLIDKASGMTLNLKNPSDDLTSLPLSESDDDDDFEIVTDGKPEEQGHDDDFRIVEDHSAGQASAGNSLSDCHLHPGIDVPAQVGETGFLHPLSAEMLDFLGEGVQLLFRDGRPFSETLVLPIGTVVHLLLSRKGFRTVGVKVPLLLSDQYMQLPVFEWQPIE